MGLRLGTNREEVVSLLNWMSKAERGLADNVARQEDIEAIKEVFDAVGRLTPESFRTHRLPLLNLPKDVLDALRGGRLEYTKAKALAQVKDEETRAELLFEALEQGLSLSQIRERVKALREPVSTKSAPGADDLKKRVSKLGKLSKESPALADPERRQKLDKLLTQIEKLLS